MPDAIAPSPVDEPSADEMAAAAAIYARKTAADQAKIDAALPAVRGFVGDASFIAMFERATALREQLPPGSPLDLHIQAMVVGMTNLRRDLEQRPAN